MNKTVKGMLRYFATHCKQGRKRQPAIAHISLQASIPESYKLLQAACCYWMPRHKITSHTLTGDSPQLLSVPDWVAGRHRGGFHYSILLPPWDACCWGCL